MSTPEMFFDEHGLKVKTVAETIGIGLIRVGDRDNKGLWWRGDDYIWRTGAKEEVTRRTRDLLGERWRPAYVGYVVGWCEDSTPFRDKDYYANSVAEDVACACKYDDLELLEDAVGRTKRILRGTSAHRDASSAIKLALDAACERFAVIASESKQTEADG